jgi:hypothetical protein
MMVNNFDPRITLAQILTYSVAIGHIPSCKHQIPGFYITVLAIMQVAH